MQRLLLISYAFPPMGGAGVQRPAKFAKYLPDHGWQPVVATVEHGSAPTSDPGLLAELPAELIIERLPTLEPGYGAVAKVSGGGSGRPSAMGSLAESLLFPDRHVLWLPTALAAAEKAAKRHGVRAVMVSAPPFSSMLLGARVARRLGLPLILDFRDEWTGYYVRGFDPGAFSIWRGAAAVVERRLVRAAAAVTAASPAYCERFRALYGGDPAKYVWIPNGYDADDFAGFEPDPVPASPGDLRIVYTGTVFNVTSLEPLWRALRLLPPGMRSHIAVEICGRVTGGEVVRPRIPGLRVDVRGYLPHDEVLRRMARADVLLMTLADLPGSERVIPGKLFEYAASRKPILALCPPGVAGALAEEFGGVRVPPNRPRALAELLGRWLRRPPVLRGAAPVDFERRRLCGLLAQTLDRVTRPT